MIKKIGSLNFAKNPLDEQSLGWELFKLKIGLTNLGVMDKNVPDF